ncbi:hypothetical protein [Aureimonas pseudogalii]|uniref:Uncharacterized protein n=1 Tax=Aureimonas pseudogalii TaxID=1744844 RepID=A0A7W6H5E8_9HYPH|nr:hypothetical protein [Aureimonas pseudogalii]MBB3998868.1 hypothetical protein [Aureimonas pseudogalii]
MSDLLREAEENGRAAGIAIIDDLVRTRDMDNCISQVRLAASDNSKFNWHLLETILALASLEMERGKSD